MDAILSRLTGDRVIWIIIFFLSVFSALAVFSSTESLAYKARGGNTEFYLIKHLVIIIIGFLLMFYAHRVPFKWYSKIGQVLLYVSWILMAFTFINGAELNEASRWLTLPVVDLTFQPSDIAKMTLIIYVAQMLANRQENIKDFHSSFLPIIIHVVLTCALIFPADLSSASLLFTTCLILMLIGRVSIKHIFYTIFIGAFFVMTFFTVATLTGKKGRIGTWQNRIANFMNTEEDSFQTRQAKIAIASGGVIGKGMGKSEQNNVLPHSYSDFIYAIIIEEYGLVGGLLILALYVLFLYRCIEIFRRCKYAFGALLAVGLSFSLVLQALINMAVTVDLLPVTGLVLPLVSMGGTSMIFTSISVGIILSVSRQIELEQQKPALAL